MDPVTIGLILQGVSLLADQMSQGGGEPPPLPGQDNAMTPMKPTLDGSPTAPSGETSHSNSLAAANEPIFKAAGPSSDLGMVDPMPQAPATGEITVTDTAPQQQATPPARTLEGMADIAMPEKKAEEIPYNAPPEFEPKSVQGKAGFLDGLTAEQMAMLGMAFGSSLMQNNNQVRPPSLPSGGGINMKPVFRG